MDKQNFKKQVLDWIESEGIDISDRKVRVYNSPRYGLEVRIYQEPMEVVNSRKSFRETSRDDKGRYGTRGFHSKKISLFTHINKEDFRKPEERDFILQVLQS